MKLQISADSSVRLVLAYRGHTTRSQRVNTKERCDDDEKLGCDDAEKLGFINS